MTISHDIYSLIEPPVAIPRRKAGISSNIISYSAHSYNAKCIVAIPRRKAGISRGISTE